MVKEFKAEYQKIRMELMRKMVEIEKGNHKEDEKMIKDSIT